MSPFESGSAIIRSGGRFLVPPIGIRRMGAAGEPANTAVCPHVVQPRPSVLARRDNEPAGASRRLAAHVRRGAR
jgi:hypothetical protein